MTFYHTRGYRLTEIEIDKHTPNYVFICGHRRPRHSAQKDWDHYFPSREEAIQHIVATCKQKICALSKGLKEEEQRLEALLRQLSPIIKQ
jgi:hypothetical protein